MVLLEVMKLLSGRHVHWLACMVFLLRWSDGNACRVHSGWIAELKLEANNWYWSLVRVTGGNDKLSLDLLRSVEINCTCTGDSFEGTGFVCWPSQDRVLILPRSCVDSARRYIRVRWSSAQSWNIITELEFVRRKEIDEVEEDSTAVSYTHLTLPTKRRV